VIVRVLNPTDADTEVTVTPGWPTDGRVEAVRLDESPAELPVAREGPHLRFAVPAHGIRSVRIA
jgi:hypothetical protein